MLEALAAMALASSGLQEQCRGKDGWSDPAPPARIHGETYYVGTCGITSILIASPGGHVLIDGSTAEGAPGIAANVQRLGFRMKDVKLILASHEHHDHVGGLAHLQQLSGATVRASPAATRVLATGKMDEGDPQLGALEDIAPVRVGPPLKDGEELAVGPTRLTAHFTPGHSPGGTSWTWRSCEATKCISIAYADSISAVSAKDYRFVDHPDRIDALLASMAAIGKLDCDLLVTPHPSASKLFERLAGTGRLINSSACAAYAARGAAALNERLAKENTTP